LTLEALEQMALARNPSIARAGALVAAARGNWVQAGLPPNPSVGYEGQQLGSGGQAEQHGILIAQEIIAPGKLRLSRAVASREIARAEQELAVQQQRVRTDVRVAFYRALLAQRQIDLTNEIVQIGQQGLQTTEALFRAEDVSRIEVLQARLELENALILAENARNRHLAAWQSLAAVAGQPGMCPQPLYGEADVLPPAVCFGDILQRVLASSPEIASAGVNIERARMAVARARVEPRPNLNVEGLINVVDNGIGGKPDAGIAVTLPVPLWNKNQGAVLQAEQELTAATAALSQLELNLQNRLAPVYERYANARAQVERYRTRILPAASESLRLTRQTFSAGEIGYLNLLTVQRTFSQTNLNFLEALRELRTAEAEIDGLLLTGSLEVR
jgi:cobalt-zinc-cadmium efflux system outer membrane protein